MHREKNCLLIKQLSPTYMRITACKYQVSYSMQQQQQQQQQQQHEISK